MLAADAAEHGVKLVTISAVEPEKKEQKLDKLQWWPERVKDIKECCLDNVSQQCLLWMLILVCLILTLILCIRFVVIKLKKWRNGHGQYKQAYNIHYR